MKHNDLAQAYLEYYARQQRGGQFVAFRGARRWQKGDGFGDRMRGVLKWAMPVLSAGASTFISEAAAAHSRGENMSDAAKSALKPTVGAVIDAIGKRITEGSKSSKQDGSGRRQKRKQGKAKKRKATKTQKPVYKDRQNGGKLKRKHKATGKVAKAKKATKKRKVKKAKRQNVKHHSNHYNF